MSKNKPSVTNIVRKLRFENGEMTQKGLADKAGVSRQTIIAIESGKYIPSLELAFKLSQVFSLKIEDIFHLNDEK